MVQGGFEIIFPKGKISEILNKIGSENHIKILSLRVMIWLASIMNRRRATMPELLQQKSQKKEPEEKSLYDDLEHVIFNDSILFYISFVQIKSKLVLVILTKVKTQNGRLKDLLHLNDLLQDNSAGPLILAADWLSQKGDKIDVEVDYYMYVCKFIAVTF